MFVAIAAGLVAAIVIAVWPAIGGPTADRIADRLEAVNDGCDSTREDRSASALPDRVRSAGAAAEEIVGITCSNGGTNPYTFLVRFPSIAAEQDAVRELGGASRAPGRLCMLETEFAVLDIGNRRDDAELCSDLRRAALAAG